MNFCQGCGQPAAGPAAPGPAASNGVLAAGIVFIACCVACYFLWPVIGLPALAISALVPASGCGGVRTGTTEMYFCSAKVALLKMIGPLVVTAVVFAFRRKLGGLVAKTSDKIPPAWRFALPSLLTALFFTLSWAAIHSQTSERIGIVPQKIFPALIGMFTFIVGRFGPAIHSALAGFLNVRDKFPKFITAACALAVPFLISYVITNQERVSEPALKEQTVVLISMLTGYLGLTPRQTNAGGTRL